MGAMGAGWTAAAAASKAIEDIMANPPLWSARPIPDFGRSYFPSLIDAKQPLRVTRLVLVKGGQL